MKGGLWLFQRGTEKRNLEYDEKPHMPMEPHNRPQPQDNRQPKKFFNRKSEASNNTTASSAKC